ncbi:MAG: esterase-like activity of phytase family protein [Pseudomonadota bacterium]
MPGVATAVGRLSSAVRPRSFWFAAAAAFALVAGNAAALEREPLDPDVRQIESFRTAPRDGDRLAFRGGLVLSGEPGLNGLSGIGMDGNSVLLVSDFGHWVGGRLVLEHGRLTDFVDVWRAPMQLPDRTIADGKLNGDAEAIAVRGEDIIVTFERPGRALIFPKAEGVLAPRDDTSKLLSNLRLEFGPQHNKPEAAFTDAAGSIVIIDEDPTFRDGARGVRLPSERFAVALEDPWRVTGADLGPGGDLFIVERRYEGGTDVGMRVRRIGTDTMARSVWDGPILIEGDFSDQIDNMEAIGVTGDGDKIELTLVSDNNANFLQRTIILRFVVSDPLPRPNPRR